MILLALKTILRRFWLLPLASSIGMTLGRCLMGNSISLAGFFISLAAVSILLIAVSFPITYHKLKIEKRVVAENGE